MINVLLLVHTFGVHMGLMHGLVYGVWVGAFAILLPLLAISDATFTLVTNFPSKIVLNESLYVVLVLVFTVLVCADV